MSDNQHYEDYINSIEYDDKDLEYKQTNLIMEDKKQRKIGTNTQLIELGYNCEYGTINKNNCTGIYFGVNTYVMPDGDYIKEIDRFKTRFERHMNPLIKNSFQGLTSFIIHAVEHRVSNGGEEKVNTRFSLLPIEISILFNTKVDYKSIKDEIAILIRLMVKYINSYQELVFDNKLYR